MDSPSTNSPPVAALSSESDFRSIALVRGSRARFVRRCDFFRVISRPHARSYGLTSRVLCGKGHGPLIGAPCGIWTAFHFGSKIAPVHRGRVMWWKFALTLFVFAAFVGAVATTTPHRVRSLQVFVATLSFLCGLATAAVWIV